MSQFTLKRNELLLPGLLFVGLVLEHLSWRQLLRGKGVICFVIKTICSQADSAVWLGGSHACHGWTHPQLYPVWLPHETSGGEQ